MQGFKKWMYALKIISDKLSSVGQFGLRNTRNLSYCPIFGQIVMNMFRQCCVQHANGCRTIFCHTVQYLDSVGSNSPMQWLVYAVSNCPMACEPGVQQSNGQTVLFPTVQWSDSPVSNFPKVGYCWVKLSNGWTAVLCPTVQWLVNATTTTKKEAQGGGQDTWTVKWMIILF